MGIEGDDVLPLGELLANLMINGQKSLKPGIQEKIDKKFYFSCRNVTQYPLCSTTTYHIEKLPTDHFAHRKVIHRPIFIRKIDKKLRFSCRKVAQYPLCI